MTIPKDSIKEGITMSMIVRAPIDEKVIELIGLIRILRGLGLSSRCSKRFGENLLDDQ